MPWIVVGTLAALVIVAVGVVVLVGRSLPVDHEATCTVRLNQPAQAIWDAITGIEHISDIIEDIDQALAKASARPSLQAAE